LKALGYKVGTPKDQKEEACVGCSNLIWFPVVYKSFQDIFTSNSGHKLALGPERDLSYYLRTLVSHCP